MIFFFLSFFFRLAIFQGLCNCVFYVSMSHTYELDPAKFALQFPLSYRFDSSVHNKGGSRTDEAVKSGGFIVNTNILSCKIMSFILPSSQLS